ncbi:MAG: glycoside hydrolase family 16 protein [Chitinophagaceae bacterium]|nr:glycoside hydrolase family 16 protein [Chitinophagaceae bacterium]
MRTYWAALLSGIILAGCASSRQGLAGKKLVWHDEFDHAGLPDASRWSYDVGGHGWGNQELQYYTAAKPENARVENGHLIIEARKESVGKNAYTSARLVTKGKGDWTYGRIDVRAKLPKGVGTWPAIWMLGSTTPLKWPDDGEIDIMEHVGYDQGKIHGSVHCKKYYHSIGTQKTATTMVPDCSENFHVYSLEWDAEKITVLVDNKAYFTFNNEHSGAEAWPFNKPFHLLLNIAVGGGWGGQKGVDESIFPQKMEVDYVRVYQ